MTKRLFDLTLSVLALFVLAPFLLIISILIVWNLGRPVLFVQERPGLGGRPFAMFKFRTMIDAHDENGQPLPDEMRLGRFGSVLRSTSLDELPELINVVRGEMSLVGPRPLLMRYLPLYTPEQARRHEVRPGITGLAQVMGRNSLTWEEKFDLDIEYVNNQSLWFDIKLLIMTIKTVFIREGIAAKESRTMPEFHGTNSKI